MIRPAIINTGNWLSNLTQRQFLTAKRDPFLIGSHVIEMLALICSAYGAWKTREASSAGRKYPSA